jgi:hypothetical protein
LAKDNELKTESNPALYNTITLLTLTSPLRAHYARDKAGISLTPARIAAAKRQLHANADATLFRVATRLFSHLLLDGTAQAHAGQQDTD